MTPTLFGSQFDHKMAILTVILIQRKSKKSGFFSNHSSNEDIKLAIQWPLCRLLNSFDECEAAKIGVLIVTDRFSSLTIGYSVAQFISSTFGTLLSTQ